ncbi:hypothetical protein P3T73_05525 [Kiritimatiellota bacterium B12222]|nr:hypothetical protein P3T73_05525 [Kiritimatiellota bacterium B12222]
MILNIISLHPHRNTPPFEPFEKLCAERYGQFLGQEFCQYAPSSWYTAIKPYNSSIFPFMAMDLMIMYRACPCQIFFGHDLLPYSTEAQQPLHIDDSMQQQINQIINRGNRNECSMEYRGFGNRIDIGLNALSTLYMEILSSLTKVECGVLTHIRSLQFERYGDPTETRTFGLQKIVAEKLEKSPVAVHKSLRSAKYHLLAETATAMRNMME